MYLFIVGVLPVTGAEATKRNYILAFAQAKAGTLEDIEPEILIKQYSSLKRIMSDFAQRPAHLDTVCGFWYHGAPGTGKSHAARARYPDYFDKHKNKWWDNYKGEATVILDDVGLDDGKWLGPFLKRWADRYCFPAEIKGSSTYYRPQRIVVTSNYLIGDIWAGDQMMVQALCRRFHVETFSQHWDDPDRVLMMKPEFLRTDCSIDLRDWEDLGCQSNAKKRGVSPPLVFQLDGVSAQEFYDRNRITVMGSEDASDADVDINQTIEFDLME